MRRWRVLPDALRPGPSGSWDDLATWTGSVIEHDGRWHMLYTGISRSERGLIQRIGLAVSEDLTHSTKHPRTLSWKQVPVRTSCSTRPVGATNHGATPSCSSTRSTVPSAC